MSTEESLYCACPRHPRLARAEPPTAALIFSTFLSSTLKITDRPKVPKTRRSAAFRRTPPDGLAV